MTKQQLPRRRSALIALFLAVAALAAGSPAAMAGGIDRIGADAHWRPAPAEVAASPEHPGGATADAAWDGTSM